jgi:hypothetical protein
MLIRFRESKTHLLLRMTGSYSHHISAAAVTQAVCLLLKPVQPNEHRSQMYSLGSWKGAIVYTVSKEGPSVYAEYSWFPCQYQDIYIYIYIYI